jgi:hypothetical protein
VLVTAAGGLPGRKPREGPDEKQDADRDHRDAEAGDLHLLGQSVPGLLSLETGIPRSRDPRAAGAADDPDFDAAGAIPNAKAYRRLRLVG